MNILWLDLETYSSVNLKSCGSYKYAEGEDTEIMLVGFALNDEYPMVLDITYPLSMDFTSKWRLLTIRVEQTNLLVSHNSMFDRPVIENSKIDYLFAGLSWADSMVKAYAHSLPGALKILSEIFDLKEMGKDEKGRDFVHMFCKPQTHRKIKRCTKITHPKEWEQFKEYLIRDVIAMREVSKKIPSWNNSHFEREMWLIDQKINDRGFLIDVDLAEKAIKALEKENRRLKKSVQEKTSDIIDSATKRDALLKYILHILGVSLPDLQKPHIERRLQDPDIPEEVKDLLRIRLEASGTGTTKYKTALNMRCRNGRIRGTLQYNGAWRTGRWGGRNLQPHNFARPVIDKGDIEIGIEAIKAGIVDKLFPSVKDVALSVLRGIIIAAPGKKLLVADYKSIEGCTLPWLAGDREKVKFYEDYNAGIEEYGIYVKVYADAFKIDPKDVTKDQRQIGKTMELALGYEGGVAAFVIFANSFNINLDEMAYAIYPELDIRLIYEAENWYHMAPSNYGLKKYTFIACDVLKRMWRENNKITVKYWKKLDRAIRKVISGSGESVRVNNVVIDKQRAWLRIKLPSGRYLSYPGIKLIDDSISYLGMDTYTKQWCRVFSHGGKFAENITQAVCADQLKYGIMQAEKNDYPIILSVHDEPITEVPDSDEYTIDKFCELITRQQDCMKGCPIAAEGFESYRYRKD